MSVFTSRHAALLTALQAWFPQFPIRSDGLDAATAQSAGLLTIPEVRVSGVLPAAEGLLRWRVQFVLGPGAAALPDVVGALRTALAAQEAYRLHAPATARTATLFLLEVVLEEAWAPSAFLPQAVFTGAPVLQVASEGFAAGITNLGALTPLGTPPAVGDYLAMMDAAGLLCVGPIAVLSDAWHLARPLPRSFAPGTLIYRLAGGRPFPCVAEEQRTLACTESHRTVFLQNGGTARVRLAEPTEQLRLAFPLLGAAEAALQEAELRRIAGFAGLAVVTRDGRLWEASLRDVTTRRSAADGPLAFEATFDVRPADAFAAFLEGEPR